MVCCVTDTYCESVCRPRPHGVLGFAAVKPEMQILESRPGHCPPALGREGHPRSGELHKLHLPDLTALLEMVTDRSMAITGK